MVRRRAFFLFCLGLALMLCRQASAAGCGPTYGADGIAVDKRGDVWFTHFEDARIGRLSPGSGMFREYLASAKSNAVVSTQAGRTGLGKFDYSLDNGFSGIALDEKNGVLWTARFGSNRLVRFSLNDEAFTEFEFRAQLFHSRGPLPMASDGSLWLLIASPADNGLKNGSLVKLTPKGEVAAEFPLPGGTYVNPVVAVDGRGRPWAALNPADGRRASLYTLDRGRWLRRHVPDVGRFVTGMAFDRQGNLWLAAPEKNAIVKLASGEGTFYPVPTANAFPHRVFVDPRGRIWFTEWNGHRIGVLSRSGAIKEYALPAEEESPLTLAFAGDGTVWFSALYNYGLLQLDPQTGLIREFAAPPPSNWFEDAASTASFCVVAAREATGRALDSAPLKPSRHPRGHGENEAAALFEKRCNTACHSWYRVDRAANRRADWTATVDRMIGLNGAKFIGEAEREEIIRYLNRNYAANLPGRQ